MKRAKWEKAVSEKWYERWEYCDDVNKYTQVVVIMTKNNAYGRYVHLHSFEGGLNQDGFNNAVALSLGEALFFIFRAGLMRVRQIFSAGGR